MDVSANLERNEGGADMYKAIEVARYIVNKCIDDDYPVSNLQLQKILYFIQRYYLQNNNQLFDDDFEAWQFGPVIPTVYYKFCGYGAMPITSKLNNSNVSDILPKDRKNIDNFTKDKRKLYPWDLVEETHRIGGAWDSTFMDGIGNHKIIYKKLIKKDGGC